MAGVKISALPPIPVAPALADIFPEVQPASGGTTYKTTFQQLYDLFNLSAGTVNAGLINQLAYYAANGNTISGLATANNGVLITSAGGVPSISSTLPTAVQANITQLGAQSAALNMNTHLINNVVDPSAAQDAATKNYVDTLIAAVATVFVARVATTGALTVTYANGSSGVGATLTNAGAMAALQIDGVSLSAGNLVLVKNQASDLQNGYYTVTTVGSGASNWVMTRSTLYDQPSEINPGDLFVITAGTANANTSWIETATVAAVGTDSITFSQYSVALPIPVTQGGTGLTSTTAYGLIAGGTTSTGNFQNVGTGTLGQILQSQGNAALSQWVSSLTDFALTTPKITTGIKDANGNSIFGFTATGSAVNYVQFANAIAANSPIISAIGSDTNIRLTLQGKGTGGAAIQGTGTNDDAAIGYVGELVSSVISSAAPVSLTDVTPANITSISLTAGDWDVWGNVFFGFSVAGASVAGWSSATSATVPDLSLITIFSPTTATISNFGTPIPTRRYSLASTTTIYLSVTSSFSAGTASSYGGIYARRRR